jgi:hypothetical protein
MLSHPSPASTRMGPRGKAARGPCLSNQPRSWALTQNAQHRGHNLQLDRGQAPNSCRAAGAPAAATTTRTSRGIWEADPTRAGAPAGSVWGAKGSGTRPAPVTCASQVSGTNDQPRGGAMWCGCAATGGTNAHPSCCTRCRPWGGEEGNQWWGNPQAPGGDIRDGHFHKAG